MTDGNRIWTSICRSVAGAFLLVATVASPGQAASPKGQCIKSVCKSQKKSCLAGFQSQFSTAKGACGAGKQCKKDAKTLFKNNKKRCGTEFKTCKTCCGGEVTTSCSVAVCGDGNTVAGEECDNGTANSNTVPDACRANCRVAACGDRVVDSAEQCEPPSQGACDASCAVVTTTTVASTTTTVTSTTTTTTLPEPCGNGTLETGEECDDGNLISTDGCTDACTTCGNGTVTAPEECDDGDLDSNDGCDADCTVTGCGNSVVTPPETCDDGNTNNDDDCPSNCIIQACEPDFGSDRTVDIEVSSGDRVAGLTVFLDYPEGKVRIPGSGGGVPAGIISDLPFGTFAATNDLDHALRQVIAGSFEILDGLLFRVHFENCIGAPGPVLGDFTCQVVAAADTSGAPLSGVTCTVVGLPMGTTTTTAASTTAASTTTTTSASTTTTTGASTTTTTTTSASTTTTTGASTTTTTISPLCGNGAPNPGETCDDGNQSNNDACPTDCVIDACTPVAGTQRFFEIHFTPNAGVNVGGITVLMDYPEGQVEIQGPPHPGGTFSMIPPGSTPIPQDHNHTLRTVVAIGGGNPLPPGRLIRVRFRDCSGATPPTPANFGCTVLDATDPFSNPVTSEVSCSVVAP